MIFFALKQPEMVPPKPLDDGGGSGHQPRHDSITHGDLMVVDRKRTKKKTPNQMAKNQDLSKAGNVNPFEILANMESAHDEINTVKNVSIKGGSPTKGAAPKRKWVKKRSRHNEVKIHSQTSPVQPTPLAHDNLNPNGPNYTNKAQIVVEEPLAKSKELLTLPTISASSLSLHNTAGISKNTSCPSSTLQPTFKSAMNIEWVTGNRFRFRDDEYDECAIMAPSPRSEIPPPCPQSGSASTIYQLKPQEGQRRLTW
ncbi:hypothetical protein RIF29_31523 [Crotalaria pallida]|uniref:Uncharacterized protein n=1 Tax=Crotalaria pallida TaxID=3830 RepID=A0AAN9I1X4_CROPI